MRYDTRMKRNRFIGRIKAKPVWRDGREVITPRQYYSAGVMMDYGQHRQARAELGDLFNDIMGAVVPGWDQRPEALKRIVVKPDPTKLLQAAQRIAPNAGGQLVQAAERAGMSVWVNTPGGQIPVSPGMAQGMYAGMPLFTQAQAVFSSIPVWVWPVLGVGVLALVIRR